MRKSHFNDEFLVLLGPIISRLFTCSNEEKKGCLLYSYLYGSEQENTSPLSPKFYFLTRRAPIHQTAPPPSLRDIPATQI